MTPQSKANSTSAAGRTPCVRVCMCVGVCLCITTKETGNFSDCLCFGDIRWGHLGCIPGPTLESPRLYISTHSGHDGFMSRSTIGGGRGCNKFVPVLGGDGTRMAPPGDLYDQSPREMS